MDYKKKYLKYKNKYLKLKNKLGGAESSIVPQIIANVFFLSTARRLALA